MWVYSQSKGTVTRNTVLIADGCYAGNDEAGQCKNNPDAQTVHNHGPLPRGKYKMLTPYDHPRVGRYAIPLAPNEANEMHGRLGFFLHGDSEQHPGMASDGCIVAPRNVRETIWLSGDRDLEVIE